MPRALPPGCDSTSTTSPAWKRHCLLASQPQKTVVPRIRERREDNVEQFCSVLSDGYDASDGKSKISTQKCLMLIVNTLPINNKDKVHVLNGALFAAPVCGLAAVI